MNPEVLRTGLYALGSVLIFVGGFDDILKSAGLPVLGLLSPSIAKLMAVAGAAIVGYAKTAKRLGDFRLQDVSDALRDTLAPPKPATVEVEKVTK